MEVIKHGNTYKEKECPGCGALLSYCNADIKKVIYGKVEFVKHSDGKTYPEKPELYDVTSLYYLNNLVGTMEASSCSEDQKSLKAFFNI